MARPHASRSALKALLHSTTAIAAALALLALTAEGAAAQEPPEPAEEETIVVTGSRIARPANIDAPTQVTTIGTQEIQSSGLTNAADILRTVPSFGVPALSSTNSNFLTSGAGVNTLELRNLEEDRTLVLVNGRRHVSGVPGSAAVDFNSIPVQMIERVEVITGGASAIYGSDALAGVINIILRDDFEGWEAGYQYGISDEDDLESHAPYVLWGTDMDNGRGNITLLASYDEQGGVFSRDRANTRIDDIALCALTGNPAECTTPFEPFFSSFSEFGAFFLPTVADASFTVSTGVGPNGTVVPFDVDVFGFNRQQFRIISVPNERYLFSGNMHYEIASDVEMFVEGTFTHTETESELEPFPLAETDLFIAGVSIDNPFVPADIRDAAIAAGDTDIQFARRLTEIGNRGTSGEREMIQLVAGLRGDIDDRWDWEAFYGYGQTDQQEASGGSVNVIRFANALDAVDLDGNPATTGDIVCADPAAVADGCVPINIFGFDSISAEAADYVRLPTSRRSRVRQEMFGATIGGPVWTLPAGEVEMVGGVEWRRESSTDTPDIFTQQGIAAGNQEFPIDGSYNVIEGYFEVEAPLLSGRPWAEELSVGGAYRISDYSTVGTTEAYTARISWSPIEDLRFRGQYARAVRAPNIGELFAPGGENFAPVADPCNGVTAVDEPGVVDDNCRAVPEIAARIAATGSFTLTQPEIQGTGGFTGAGNPNLDTETADSYNVGVVYQHDFGDPGRLMLSVDYYQIEIDDLIDTIDRQQSVDLCFNAADFPNAFCGALVRDTAGAAFQQGELLEVNSGFINEGTLETSGIDVSATYSFSLVDVIDRDWGDLALRMNYTHLLDFEQTKFEVGTDSAGLVGFSEDKMQAGVLYDVGPLQASWEMTYLSDARPDNAEGSPFRYDVGDYAVHDFQVGWDVTETANLYVGVNNAFDEDAPIILSGVPGNTTGTDTAADVYDPIGRAWYVGFRLRN